ncbi:GerMN domain-containing protein [Blastococcus saxobsidens]|uniref:Sporulation and spore germination protein n=1 Tax=Blastococcus saxobsidens TaxID=138336 RepID=A0A4Q7Y948_9ACTN|nr:GerMN domain-containing protein [Blastococcus saxobsidens]RZU32589.1 sporulation and spore germination protein [Blastococcus saxobsidens]
MTRRLAAGLLLTAVALGGCGVPTQQHPEVLGVPAPEAPADPAATLGGQEAQIWLVRGARLEAVSRPVSPADVPTVLQALLAGPTPEEAASGLRTALAPQTLQDSGPTPEDQVVTLDVTREFTGLVGGNQQLAVAQLVWTATQFPTVDRVRFSTEGEPLEVPTDRGLTDRPVGRADHASVAPVPAQTPSAPALPEPAGSVPATSAPASPTGRRPAGPRTAGGRR